jgi:hypothetical protein
VVNVRLRSPGTQNGYYSGFPFRSRERDLQQMPELGQGFANRQGRRVVEPERGLRIRRYRLNPSHIHDNRIAGRII